MDTFIEQLVVKKADTTDKLKIALLTIALVLAIILIFILIGMFPAYAFFGIILEFGAGYGYWYLFTSFRIEYEYALTNGELDVDKIISKRKRKRLITVKLKDMEIMARVSNKDKQSEFNQTFKTMIDASSSPASPNAFFLTTHHDKLGFTRLIFEPDQRILEISKSMAPRKFFD